MVAPASENTDSEQKPYLFKPGKSGNPAGRPKGARSKLGSAFLEAMLADFDAHGKDVIEAVRVEKPDQYLKVVASILPKEIALDDETTGAIADIILERRKRAGIG